MIESGFAIWVGVGRDVDSRSAFAGGFGSAGRGGVCG